VIFISLAVDANQHLDLYAVKSRVDVDTHRCGSKTFEDHVPSLPSPETGVIFT